MILLNSDSEMNVPMENSPDYISKHYFSKFFQKVRFTFYNYLLHYTHSILAIREVLMGVGDGVASVIMLTFTKRPLPHADFYKEARPPC